MNVICLVLGLLIGIAASKTTLAEPAWSLMFLPVSVIIIYLLHKNETP